MPSSARPICSAAACLRIAQQTNRSPGEVRERFAENITCYSNNGNPTPLIDVFKYDPLPWGCWG